MPLTHSDSIEVKLVKGKGRGVFALKPIAKGEVVERVPVLVFAAEENDENPVLGHYVFAWGRGTVALALGYGSLYNHSYRPNCRYDDVGRQTKVFTAIRDIKEGEELTINYHGSPERNDPVEFEVVENDD